MLRNHYHTILVITVLTAIALGAILYITGQRDIAHITWAIADILVFIPLAWDVGKDLKRGQLGVDIIALLAIIAALITKEYLAGAIIALMLSGGNAIEEYAEARAGRELSELAKRAPRTARIRRGEQLIEVDANEVKEGDTLSVRAGEVIPVDGTVMSSSAVVDQAAITGESHLVTIKPGGAVLSGSANAGDAFELVALRAAKDSMYASIVKLVEDAVARKAPMVRMADRYAVFFLIVTLLLTGGAWIAAGELVRALAVLVIATPCPLILAPPIALVAGTSRAARRGVIVKGSAAIEALGKTRSVLIDKTGTLTLGTPTLERIELTGETAHSKEQLLLAAAAVEQLSMHTIAGAIVHAARSDDLPIPTDVQEVPGQGVAGVVFGENVRVGSYSFAMEKEKAYGTEQTAKLVAEDPTEMNVYVAIDGNLAGRIVLIDAVRSDAKTLAQDLQKAGISRVVMATGDVREVAEHVASELGISEVHADCTPQQKLELINKLRAETASEVLMVGDGVNDAPALAAADVGIAMGSAGATAASEAAEAVIISSRISAIVDALKIGQRSLHIARQSVFVGMTLSIVGMVFAALGYIPPIYGALIQEVIDLAVVINALRALRG